MTEASRFKKGQPVILRSRRDQGTVMKEPVLDGGEYWYRVKFGRQVENIVESDLDPVDDIDDSIEELATAGRWGTVRAFRCALAVERIQHTNRSTVYSYKAQRILFEPYQYKPLLKVLDSPDRRLLIADEVGLGKTIEAGLILTELEARRSLDKVLIVCPSRLRDKWSNELNRKFDQDFQILDKRTMHEYVDRYQRNPRKGRLRGIISMQTLRNEELRNRLTAEVGELDMVVVDEAHHARNPSTQISEMLRELCEISGCVLFLTATPLHLGSVDLFTLLSALRPVEFRDQTVFDQQLRHHTRVHDAGRLIRTQNASALADAATLLEEVFCGGIPANQRDPIALQVLSDMRTQPPQERREWIDLERRIQELHPLSTVVTRTRKRDVQEQAPVRRARVVTCRFSTEEDELYQRLVEGTSRGGWIQQPLGFGQIQRARQAASCLPATAKSKLGNPAQNDDDANELTDVLPGDVDGVVAATPPAAVALSPRWSGKDSKFAQFLRILEMIQQTEPGAKVLVFTFFIGTSKYLVERLSALGIGCLRIAGDVRSDPHHPDEDERGIRMRQFQEDPAVRVLVSTEVGSEGLDFQFCHHLVNYDLPWNPMVVEQRIGRIDRYGQESSFVQVHNLVVEGTVEDRILLRLYQRIGIFQESIGDLEAILGETISELQRDYIKGILTPDEADRRVEEAAQAINRRKAYFEQVERNAGELFGHEEYIRDEMQRIGRLGRYVSQQSLIALIESFLESHHPNVRLWEEFPGVYGLRLSSDLRQAIQDAARGEPAWIDRSRDGTLLITFQGDVAFRHPEVDLVNVSHPLLRAAVTKIKVQLESPVPRVAQARLELNADEDPALSAGLYFVAVFSHTVDGIRARRMIEATAWTPDSAELSDAESSERLLHLVLDRGGEWNAPTSGPAMPAEVWDRMLAAARARNRELLASEQRENEALYTRRRAALQAEHAHDLRIKQTRLHTAEQRGHTRILPAMRGQIQKAETEFRAHLADLEGTRKVEARLSDPVAVCCIEVVRRAD